MGHLSAELRYDGFARAVTEFGLDLNEVITARGNFTFKSGTEMAHVVLDRPDRPTAVICANDDMAAGAMLSAHRLGLSIPKTFQSLALTIRRSRKSFGRL